MRSYSRKAWGWAAIAGTAVVAGCASADVDDGATEVTEVVFVGDSLGEESAPHLAEQLDGPSLRPMVFGGTAPCDWLDDDLAARETSLVVLTFAGNSQTDCMADGSGGHLRGAALVDRYRADVTTLIERARDAGARVLLVGQPIRADSVGGNDEVEGLNSMYRDLADREGVAFVDAGAAVEGDGGVYTATLPCLPEEPQCDPSGANPVRSDDGLHFCPGPAEQPDPCPAYASGAWRFASRIADAVEALDDFE